MKSGGPRVRNYSVGVRGFEPPTSSSRTTRANRAALHPEIGGEFSPLSPPKTTYQNRKARLNHVFDQ